MVKKKIDIDQLKKDIIDAKVEFEHDWLELVLEIERNAEDDVPDIGLFSLTQNLEKRLEIIELDLEEGKYDLPHASK